MVTRIREVTPASIFFAESLPYYVNRVEESYGLHYHEHEFTEVCYVGEGRGYHHIEEETIPVSRGDLFILPLGTSHVFRPHSPSRGDPLVVYNFIFVADRVAEALRGFPALSPSEETLRLLNLQPGPATWKPIRDTSGFFRTFFANAYEEFRQRRIGYIPRLHALFVLLVTEIDRHLEPTGGGTERRGTERLIGDVLAHLRDKEAFRLSAAEAAAIVQMSERHFHRMFAKETGYTFNRYVQNLRIERSCELLRTTRWTVPEIAEAVGYQDKGYFQKLFKKATGQTPRAYRNGE
ncbi:helix-turn-helix domain-containing protein [Cohnella fermenti]|uniref:Helix-turn-helix domain-containing protein n=1 Tax=Cohnella fermenti TaxID=2565925 RepID=A0A4S4C8Z0_9BACL|nr:helix-turn-helix domain-containing protein [Cohnella fermenti]THF84512.1 helix-turn-helix domain-containing protein [Cohnella fermenti]